MNNTRKGLNISELGLSFILTAFAMSMFIRIFFINIPAGNYLLLIGMLMFFPYRNFFNNFFTQKWDGKIVGVVVFHLIALLYYALSDFNEPLFQIFHYIVIVFCVALTYTQYEKDIQIRNVVKCVIIESTICVVLSFYIFQTGMDQALYAIDTEKRIFDYLTPGGISVTNIACCAFLIGTTQKKKYTTLLWLMIVFDMLVIIMSQKRTPFIVGAFIISLYLYRQLTISASKFFFFIVPLLAIAFYFMLLLYNALFIENVEYVFKGITDFINGTNQLDETNSASIRYYNRKHVFDTISHFTNMEYLFGKGYMTLWFDNPLLQSYLDMGIYGFISFLYYIVIIPARAIFVKVLRNDDNVFWVFCIASYSMLGFISTGHPYNQGKWTPICLLILVINGVYAQHRKKHSFIHYSSENTKTTSK